MGGEAGKGIDVVSGCLAQWVKACRPLAQDSTEKERQSQATIISHQRLHQRALGTAWLAACMLVAFGREVPDSGGGGGKPEQHVLFTKGMEASAVAKYAGHLVSG